MTYACDVNEQIENIRSKEKRRIRIVDEGIVDQ